MLPLMGVLGDVRGVCGLGLLRGPLLELVAIGACFGHLVVPCLCKPERARSQNRYNDFSRCIISGSIRLLLWPDAASLLVTTTMRPWAVSLQPVSTMSLLPLDGLSSTRYWEGCYKCYSTQHTCGMTPGCLLPARPLMGPMLGPTGCACSWGPGLGRVMGLGSAWAVKSG